MAYDSHNLSALSYANGFTLWHYRSPDALFDITAPGYFNDAAAMLAPGDCILTNSMIDRFFYSATLWVEEVLGGVVSVETQAIP